MLIRRHRECEEFVAGDDSILRELLHPDKQAVELRYSLAHAIVPAGQVTTPHRLRTSEVYYIISGTAEMHIDGETSTIGPGDAVYIPPGATQFVRNSSNEALKFVCIVDPAWRQEDEEILERAKA